MDRIEITEDDFIVTCPHGRKAEWADQFPGDVPADALEARWAELERVLKDRPSPAAVVAAVRERLLGVASKADLEALRWAARELHQRFQ